MNTSVMALPSCYRCFTRPQELTAILATLPPPAAVTDPEVNRAAWAQWQAGLSQPITLPQELPALRVLLVLDNLTGHKTPDLVLWLFAHGVMPLYTPLSGSWLNMAESIQRIIVRRALAGQYPQTPRRSLICWSRQCVLGTRRRHRLSGVANARTVA